MDMEVENFLTLIGKIVRKIDEEMEKEGKSPIGEKILSKENFTVRDVISIVNKISGRFCLYLDENEKKQFIMNELPKNLWEDLNKLEKDKKIKFYIFLGYLMGNKHG